MMALPIMIRDLLMAEHSPEIKLMKNVWYHHLVIGAKKQTFIHKFSIFQPSNSMYNSSNRVK